MNKTMKKPPLFLKRILRGLVKIDYLEEIEGDLEELYYSRVESRGEFFAKISYTVDVFRSISFRRPSRTKQNHNLSPMFRNIVKMSLRSLVKQKGSTAINLAGLALGITGSVVLYLFIDNANSFDRYHSKSHRIYRVVSQSMGNHGLQFTQAIPKALPAAVKNEFTGVEEVAFTSYHRGSLIGVVRSGQLKKYEEPKGLAFSEPSFFRIFDRKILIGSAEKGLDDPNEAIISQRWALKYFGKEDAVGEFVNYEQQDYQITAVMEDFPTNTDLPFDLILSYVTVDGKAGDGGWGDYSDTDNCYVLLKDNAALTSVEKSMPDFVKKYTGNDIDKSTFLFQPLRDLHSDARFGNYNAKLPKQAQTVFAVIAIFLLITSCINFVNMATAEASKRTKEVGIRKILGGGRGHLMLQLLFESFLVVVMSIIISFVGVTIFLAWLNPLMDISLTLEPTPSLIVFLVVLLLVVTLLSGLYPAWLMSSFRPADAVRNLTMNRSAGGAVLRRGLVVVQFFISQLFIIGTLVLVKQMDFMQSMDTGFHRANIITIPIPKTEKSTSANDMKSMKDRIMGLADVSSVSLAYAPPSYKAVIGTSVSVGKEPFDIQMKPVDADYVDLFGIRLLAGEGLSEADTATGVLVNEEFVRVAGLSPQDVIGTQVSMWNKYLPIRGIVKNFNTQSLSEPIEPVVMVNNASDYRSLSVKIGSQDAQATIRKIQGIWEASYPEYMFQYNYLDDQIKSLYRGETKMTSLLKVFAGIAIFIGCLGLLGLFTFIANARTKEIGVRKLLGASVRSIVFLFTSELGKLLIVSFVLAAPIAGYLMNLLLQEFAYRIELGPMIFFTAFGVTFMIAFATISYRAFIAAIANPIESLKTE